MSDRRHRRPAVESLEGRVLLAGSNSPINPVPVHPQPIGTPTPKQLGAAYHQVEAIQVETLQALSAAHRRLYAAFDRLAARANPEVARDRRILQQGADIIVWGAGVQSNNCRQTAAACAKAGLDIHLVLGRGGSTTRIFCTISCGLEPCSVSFVNGRTPVSNS